MRPRPRRLDRLPAQYFVRILGAAARARYEPGLRLIDLGRGNPDLPPPVPVVEVLRETAAERTSAVHGYAPFAGLPEMRAAIAERYAVDHGVSLDPEREVAVLPGTKTGMMLVAMAVAERGDVVRVPDPGYPDYASAVAFADARLEHLPLREDDGYQPDPDALADPPDGLALTLLNYPSNPCAVLERPGTFEAAVAAAERSDSVLLHDLTYGFLAFDGRRARSVLEVEGAREVAVELWSASKVLGMAGWRVGFLVGNAEVVSRVQLLLDHLFAGVWVAVQRAVIAGLLGPQDHVRERVRAYEARRDVLVRTLRGAGAEVRAPEGTFYAWWRVPDGLTAERILRQARVSVAPGEGFGPSGAGHVRLSLAVPDEDVAEGAERLAALLR